MACCFLTANSVSTSPGLNSWRCTLEEASGEISCFFWFTFFVGTGSLSDANLADGVGLFAIGGLPLVTGFGEVIAGLGIMGLGEVGLFAGFGVASGSMRLVY